MNLFRINNQIALFLALNVVFAVYLFSVDLLSGILLIVFSLCALIVYNSVNHYDFINVSGFEIDKDAFEKIIALIPFKVKFMDLDENVLISNHSAISSDSGAILDRFELQDSEILRVKINDKIYHFFVYMGAIYDDKKSVVAYLQVELVMDDILGYLNKGNIKEISKNEKALVAFDSLNDALMIYEMGKKASRFGANVGESSHLGESAHLSESADSSDSSNFSDSSDSYNDAIRPSDSGKFFITSPSFGKMLDFVDLAGQNNYILDLFHPSERARVETILNSLKNESVLFESLMINDKGTFPVEINANIISADSKNLINLNIRDTSFRKAQEQKRDRARILKMSHNEILQKIHILYLALDKINNLLESTQGAIEGIIAEHNEMQDELNGIIALQEKALGAINEIINFYAHTDIKTMVDIINLIENMKHLIFTKYILNNTTISIIQKGTISEIYCDKNALKIVLISLIKNSLENINYAKGSNFYGKIIVEIAELNDSHLLLSIEDNGGGTDEGNLERCFDAFYSTHSDKVGLGLSACKIIVEDLLNGEIMAMNTENGFRVEITLPRE